MGQGQGQGGGRCWGPLRCSGQRCCGTEHVTDGLSWACWLGRTGLLGRTVGPQPASAGQTTLLSVPPPSSEASAPVPRRELAGKLQRALPCDPASSAFLLARVLSLLLPWAPDALGLPTQPCPSCASSRRSPDRQVTGADRDMSPAVRFLKSDRLGHL